MRIETAVRLGLASSFLAACARGPAQTNEGQQSPTESAAGNAAATGTEVAEQAVKLFEGQKVLDRYYVEGYVGVFHEAIADPAGEYDQLTRVRLNLGGGTAADKPLMEVWKIDGKTSQSAEVIKTVAWMADGRSEGGKRGATGYELVKDEKTGNWGIKDAGDNQPAVAAQSWIGADGYWDVTVFLSKDRRAKSNWLAEAGNLVAGLGAGVAEAGFEPTIVAPDGTPVVPATSTLIVPPTATEAPKPTVTLEPSPTPIPQELVANMLAKRGIGEWISPNPRFGGVDVYFLPLEIVKDLEIKVPDGRVVGTAAWAFGGVFVDDNGLTREMFFTFADEVYSGSGGGVNLYGRGVDLGVLDEFEAILKQEAEGGHVRIRGVGVLASKEDFAKSLAWMRSQNGAAKGAPLGVQEFMRDYYEGWGAEWKSLKEGGGAQEMKVIVGVSSIATGEMVDIPDGLN